MLRPKPLYRAGWSQGFEESGQGNDESALTGSHSLAMIPTKLG